jgi:hypothetical protein
MNTMRAEDTKLKQRTTKGIITVLLMAAVALCIPLVAMQFTKEVVWTLSDFIIAGVLIVGTGLAYVMATRKPMSTGQRVRIGAGLGFIFLVIWVELAVGIFH